MYAQCLIKNEKLCKFIFRYDTIIPVPLHSKRKMVRGYNQAQLVAEEVIKRLNKEYYVNSNIVCENNVLIKTKNLQPQSKKRVDSRFNEIKDAFKVQNKEKIVNKNVLIFDDIYTTGSTANECKRVLANSGAKKVSILTIAKDYIE